jgi:hypothetical protein
VAAGELVHHTDAGARRNWSTQHLECEGSLWERGGVGRTELVVRR